MSSVTTYAESVASCHSPTPIRSPSPAAVAAALPLPVRRQLDFPIGGGGDGNLDADDEDEFLFRAAEEMERSLHDRRAAQGLTPPPPPPVALASPAFLEKQCICGRGPCDVEWREPRGWTYVCSASPKCNHVSYCEQSDVNPNSQPAFWSHPEPNYPLVFNTRGNRMANATTQVTVSPQGADTRTPVNFSPQGTGTTTPVTVNPQGAGATTPVNFSPQGAKSSGEVPTCKCTAGKCNISVEKGVRYYVCHIKKGYGACSHHEPINVAAEEVPLTGYNNPSEIEHLVHNPGYGACSHHEPIDAAAEEVPLTGYSNPREAEHLVCNPVSKEANGHNLDMMEGHNETRLFNPDEPPKYDDDDDWPFDIVEGDVVPTDYLSPAHPSSIAAVTRGSPTMLQQPVGVVELETPTKSPMPPKYTFSPTTPPSKDCYRCSKEGHFAVPHFAVNCPKNTACYRCNVVGHWVKDCPEALTEKS